MDTAWARTPRTSISASRVPGSYCERERGSGAFFVTPLTVGSSRTTSSPILDRSARPSRSSHSSNGRGIAWLCTSIAAAFPPPGSGGRLSLDSSARIQFLHVLRVEVHVGRAGSLGLRLLAGWNLTAEPYRRLLATCHAPLERSLARSDDLRSSRALPRQGVVPTKENSQGGPNGSDAELHP